MRATRAAVALLLLPCQAWGGIVECAYIPNQPVAGSEVDSRRALSLGQGVLETFGVRYDVLPRRTARTEFVRAGVHTLGFNGTSGSGTKDYGLWVHAAWNRGVNPVADGYTPDSLTLATTGPGGTSMWPADPNIWLGDLGVGGGANFTNSAGCSTGIVTNNPNVPSMVSTHVQYLVGESEVWHTSLPVRVPANQAAGGWYTRGYWRPLVGTAVSAAERSEYMPATVRALDPDSCGRSAAPDTVGLWERGRFEGDPAPLLFADMNAGDPMLFAMALARADRVLRETRGDTLITRQVKSAFVVRGMFKTNHYNFFTSLDTIDVGGFFDPESTDIQNQRASFDSLDALSQRYGFPIYFQVDADSMVEPSMQYQKELIQRVRNYRIVLASYTGTRLEPEVKHAGRHRFHDIFGHNRLRTITPAGWDGTFPVKCADTDTGAVACLWQWALARADSMWGRDRVSRVLVPAYGDWTPTTVQRGDWRTAEELLYVLGNMGTTGIVCSFMSPDNSVHRTRGQPRGPLGLFEQTKVWPVRKPGVSGAPTVGRIAFLPTRGSDIWTAAIPTWAYTAANVHRFRVDEELVGRFRGIWYLPHQAFHADHNQQVRPLVHAYNAQLLGGAGPGTYPTRHAWHWFKHTAMQYAAVNKLNGRVIAKIGTLEELAADQIAPVPLRGTR